MAFLKNHTEKQHRGRHRTFECRVCAHDQQHLCRAMHKFQMVTMSWSGCNASSTLHIVNGNECHFPSDTQTLLNRQPSTHISNSSGCRCHCVCHTFSKCDAHVCEPPASCYQFSFISAVVFSCFASTLLPYRLTQSECCVWISSLRFGARVFHSARLCVCVWARVLCNPLCDCVRAYRWLQKWLLSCYMFIKISGSSSVSQTNLWMKHTQVPKAHICLLYIFFFFHFPIQPKTETINNIKRSAQLLLKRHTVIVGFCESEQRQRIVLLSLVTFVSRWICVFSLI